MQTNVRRFEDIPKGDDYVVCWNPAYECRPSHVNELYGTNPDDTYLVDDMEDLATDSEFDPEDELDEQYKSSNALPKSWTISGIRRIRVAKSDLREDPRRYRGGKFYGIHGGVSALAGSVYELLTQ